MSLDITDVLDGSDLIVRDSIAPKAANVLNIQLGTLEYIPDFGVDLKYFLDNIIEFQNDSFKAYLIQRLIESRVNVVAVEEVIEALFSKYQFEVGEQQSSEGLIR